MSRLRILVIVGAVCAPLAGALAADVPGDYSPPPVERVVPEFFDLSGWYVRADTGYAWGRLDSAATASGYPSPTDDSLGGGFVAGIGGGIKTRWLRTDVTIDYTAPLKYSGTAVTADDVTAKISGWSTLFNGYIDLGKWYGVSPYIGAGAGVGYMTVSDYSSTVSPPFSGGDHSQWNFNWAAMAGLGYAITPNLMLDVGYRYMNFGDVETASDAFGQTSFKNVAAHEVRVGMRWNLNDMPLVGQ